MEFHTLDLIMYILIIIWIQFINYQFKQEIDSINNYIIISIFTVIYLILFAFWPNWNWVDIFKSMGLFIDNINFKL